MCYYFDGNSMAFVVTLFAKLTIQQITNLFIVNLKIGNFNMKFEIDVHIINMVEDILHNTWYYALLFRIAKNAL